MLVRPAHKLLCLVILPGLVLAGSLCGCGRHQASTSGKPVLAASVFPVAELVHRVAGDRWQVVTLLPPGYSPHGYTILPVSALGLQKAKVLFAVGPGLDQWAVQAAKAATGHRKIVLLGEVLHLPAQGESASAAQGQAAVEHDEHADVEADGEHAENERHGEDPHIWLDPVLAEKIVDVIASVLSEQDPTHRDFYQHNAAATKKDLAVLNDEYRSGLANCRTRTLVVFHPAYGYLARRYDLHQVALMGLGGVTPARMEQVASLIHDEHVRAVYREPQYESRWIEAIGRQTGAKVLVLDPMGQPNRPGYDSYFDMMRSNLAALKEGLGCGS